MHRQLVALVFVGIVLMAGVGIVQSGYQNSVTERQTATSVDGESWTVDEDNVTTLNESGRDVVFNRTVTVYNSSGAVVAQDGNYTWFDHNGTVQALNGSALSDGATATIDYGYTEPSNEQRLVRDVLMLPVNVLGGSAMLILGMALLLAAVVIFARVGGY